MFILENLPWNCSNNSCSKFARNAQKILFVNPNIIDSQYDFPSTPTGMATFCSIIWHKLFLSSPYLLHFVGRILFDGQMASRKYDATACWLIWSVAVKLFLFDVRTTFLPPLAFAGNVLYLTRLNSASCSWRSLIFWCCSSITPAFDESNWTFLNGDTAEYEDLLNDVVCMDVSEYSMITQKMRFCAAFLKVIIRFD